MVRRTFLSVCLVALTCLALLPAAAFAQVASTITGSAKDTTGAVLPGVTVEVASPALIEKVRTAVTSAEGLYRVIDLRPGTYTVTFTLTGFNTFRREGLDLPAGFTATVNAEMRVGNVAESITVSGAAPLVDTQSTEQRRTLSSENTESLPASLRAPAAYVVFLPGVVKPPAIEPSRDLRRISIHGSRVGDSIEALDGAQYPLLNGGGGFPAQYYFNAGNIQEITVDTSGLSIENLRGGMVTNIVPKEGANTYHGDFVIVHSDNNLVQNNLTEALKTQGLKAVNHIKQVWDYNVSWGGAIAQDKVWFWNSFRYWGDETYQANVFYNATPAPAWRYTPDLNRQYVQKSTFKSASLRLTWQASQKNKFSVFYDRNPVCICDRADNDEGALQAPESTDFFHVNPNYLAQLSWKSPMTSRLFLEATVQKNYNRMNSQMQPGNDPATVGAYDTALNIYYRTTPRLPVISLGPEPHNSETYRATASYVNGSHNLKFGFNVRHGLRSPSYSMNGGDIFVETSNFEPTGIVELATPFRYRDRLNKDGGIFAGDQWVLKRLTLNYGARFEFMRASVDAQSMPAGRFVPARSYPQVKDVPNWNDGTIRLAGAYDVFGDGKTAVKGTWGKYVVGEQLALADLANPIGRTITNTTRDWTDANHNFIPDCDLTNRFLNGECGQISNLNFGLNDPNATLLDASLFKGTNKRLYQWEQSLQVQHQLISGIAVNFGYFHRTYHNFRVTENTQVTPVDYQPFSIRAPVDSRLPDGGGYVIDGLYDVTPTKFGQVTSFATLEKNFGQRHEVYDGIDLTTTIRLAKGLNVQGGLNMGRTLLNTCFSVDSPQAQFLKQGVQASANCDVTPPFQPAVKFLGVIPLPWWGLQVGTAFQSVAGPQITAAYRATRAEVIGLGRPLNTSRTGNIPLIKAGTMYNGRINTFDGRLTKELTVSRTRIQVNLDAYNLFNSSAVIAQNNTFGANWLAPQAIVTGRWLKLSGRVAF